MTLLTDLQMGHYLKIPPFTILAIQITGTSLGSLVYFLHVVDDASAIDSVGTRIFSGGSSLGQSLSKVQPSKLGNKSTLPVIIFVAGAGGFQKQNIVGPIVGLCMEGEDIPVNPHFSKTRLPSASTSLFAIPIPFDNQECDSDSLNLQNFGSAPLSKAFPSSLIHISPGAGAVPSISQWANQVGHQDVSDESNQANSGRHESLNILHCKPQTILLLLQCAKRTTEAHYGSIFGGSHERVHATVVNQHGQEIFNAIVVGSRFNPSIMSSLCRGINRFDIFELAPHLTRLTRHAPASCFAGLPSGTVVSRNRKKDLVLLVRNKRTRGFSTHSRLLQATQFQSNTQSDITSKQIIDALNPAPVFSLGDSAAKRINEINGIEKKNQALRIIVDSGGCHGYQYKMELTTDQEEDDIIFEKDGARVLVDPVSIDLIRGSRLEYVEELIGSSFQVVDNPNAESSCGCKVSFNIKI
ncbi:hypothetical protein BJ742DRAFT_738264 [Cladochytrium replicatum]|nr:hypothetical protein BJ742DRAFT_738264 [Cladochytrium replicatum]